MIVTARAFRFIVFFSFIFIPHLSISSLDGLIFNKLEASSEKTCEPQESLSDSNSRHFIEDFIFVSNKSAKEVRAYYGGRKAIVYENRTTSVELGPLPAQQFKSADAFIKWSGVKGIKSETQRAIALWNLIKKNRYHYKPVTGFDEEHDVIKHLAIYGYGFCDDVARVLAAAGKLVGLRSRIWHLSGHVVPELFADGKWILLDPDHEVYFYKNEDGRRHVLGVESLIEDPKGFEKFEGFSGRTIYPDEYRDIYLTKQNNQVVENDMGTADHRLEYYLWPGERISFTNFNIGKHFKGNSEFHPPQYFNGHLFIPFSVQFILSANKSNRRRAFNDLLIKRQIPFPIVGAKLFLFGSSLEHVEVEVISESPSEIATFYCNNSYSCLLDLSTRLVGKKPSYSFNLRIRSRKPASFYVDQESLILLTFQHSKTLSPDSVLH